MKYLLNYYKCYSFVSEYYIFILVFVISRREVLKFPFIRSYYKNACHYITFMRVQKLCNMTASD